MIDIVILVLQYKDRKLISLQTTWQSYKADSQKRLSTL